MEVYLVKDKYKNFSAGSYLIKEKKFKEYDISIFENVEGNVYYKLIKQILQDPDLKTDLIIILEDIVVIKSLTIYYKNWETNGWLTKYGKPIKDAKIIKKILKLSEDRNIKYKYERQSLFPFDVEKVKEKLIEEMRSFDEEKE